MHKKIIAIDIDDVLADSTESLRRVVNKRLGVELTKEHYRVSGPYSKYYDRVWETHGIADRISFGTLSDEMIDDQSHVPVMSGAVEAVEHLSRRFSIILVTARDPKWEEATRLWLRDNFGSHCTNLHFAGRKHDGSSKTKGELCAEVGADYLLDDNLDHCHSAAKEGVATVLFGSYGWHENVPEEQIVCKDWTAVREFFDEQRSDQL